MGGPLKPRKPGFFIFYDSFRGREVFQCIRGPILVRIGGIGSQIGPSRHILVPFSSKTGFLDFPSPLVLGCVPRRGVFFLKKLTFGLPGLSRPGQACPDQACPGQACPGQACPGQACPGQACPGPGPRPSTFRPFGPWGLWGRGPLTLRWWD